MGEAFTSVADDAFAVHARSLSMPEDEVRTVHPPQREGTHFDAAKFDFGTLYGTYHRDFRFGMGIQNIGSDMTFLEQPAMVPAALRAGMSICVFDRGSHRFLIAGEFSHPPENAERADLGGEYALWNLIFPRGGPYNRFAVQRF